ncbi:hypothetical protein D1AOALGA4SA_6740 [Olavius algarvensis Delta 1 endosymbiont]|nr:hypothetical protein D1AOALGA4SA_6740 [Olavius algarvensis Delta 1 endosymbiont]
MDPALVHPRGGSDQLRLLAVFRCQVSGVRNRLKSVGFESLMK